jgi:uncharacterized DUF497 family protein
MLWAISNLPGIGARRNPTWASTGVSFEEAKSVFLDESARLIDDPDHSGDEDRFLLLGYSFQARCLIVSHYPRSRFCDPVDLGQAPTAREEEM